MDYKFNVESINPIIYSVPLKINYYVTEVSVVYKDIFVI